MTDETITEATCVVCGCTDSQACDGGCAWHWVDREAGRGLCTSCEDPGEVRYIVNTATKEIHSQEGLTEECNTDDIAADHKEHASSERFAELLTEGGWRLCGHCLPAEPKEASDATS